MKFINRNWYNIGGIVAICVFCYLVMAWGNLDVLVRVQLMSFIAILVHQFEEYGFPGGEPAIMNIALQNSDIPDRYPLNQFSAMVTNVIVTYTVYLLPVFFPNIIWLGLMPMLFGFAQFIVHGVMTTKKLKYFYNPGLGAVVLLHYPIGIYYIYYITSHHLVSITDWIIAIIYLVLVTAVIVNGLTYRLFPNRNSKYAFDPVEMERFHVKERMARIKK